MAEKLREQVVGLHVIFGFYLAFKSVHFVQLFGLMVTTAHEEVLGEADFPWEHEHDDFDGEWATIDEVAIEDVRVLFWWISIKLENVHQIIVLAVNITTDCDLLQLVNRDLHQRVKWLENLRRLLNNHGRVLLVQDFPFTLVFHERDDPFGSDILNTF